MPEQRVLIVLSSRTPTLARIVAKRSQMCSTMLITAASLLVLATACGGDEDSGTRQPGATTAEAAGPYPIPQGSEPIELDPADFVARIDNPYWPMAPGSRWIYRETDAEGNEQKVEVTVTDRTKTIMGVGATVVHDVVTEDGALVEDTLDWYAQDIAGNIWYLGEDTKEYENGKLTIERTKYLDFDSDPAWRGLRVFVADE